ncbi:hypothetical protein EV659_10482 [Rhodothalassium salexigens DSM 2132]|uniref:Alkylation response protein AidB-like acyl-CoA dehydrogenase n=1 Tax=Rhodothalassium salexigens DSM 2132 TaxID=1188247 RepID=A0A4R2PID0_RHOSA|nr:acyl-CoA dehydrogenase family protein [Rhodothalassium salexigens]MBB4211310.1 hypothetical protein [Rhodothalassium salexigens DSM 2132]MBK1639366.1 pimeloyl-CoA dehydrogenase large subunit [Rhodothalassium salexigens DSM 2132]TCP35232.1 hypothetical protein EV659_10482 [Rhodothalassium salexigens DSM 2132]
MDLSFTPEEAAFRDEVRAFFRDALPPAIADKQRRGEELTKQDHVSWQKILYERGWIAPAWPERHGGCGWGPTRQYIFNTELGLSGAPRPIPFGLNMVGPVIYTFGTDEQKAQHLPGILTSDVWWAQGYSEPGAGSDLAALRMTAERDGNDYVLNGTKLWTTLAHYADWIFCLVRTSKEAKPQEGISFLLVDMTSPGISVDPIITIDRAHHVNQVTFEDVRVPVANRVGEEGMGWTCAKFLLAHERQTIADVGTKKRQLALLRRLARTLPAGAGTLGDDPSFRHRLADLEIQVSALEYTELRYLDAQHTGTERGIEPSVLKIRGTELQQKMTELAVEALGYYALPFPAPGDSAGNVPDLAPDGSRQAIGDFLFARAATIYGGSNEIQRNILAKMLLRAA